MIDINQMQIGDWILVTHSGKPRMVKVTFLDPSQIGYDIKDEVIVKSARAFNPIPLTKGLLEKNGFVYEYDYGSYYRSRWGDISSDKYVTVGWNSKGEMYQYEVITPLNTAGDIRWSKKSAFGNTSLWLHELQHALRLCGLNELANSFKV